MGSTLLVRRAAVAWIAALLVQLAPGTGSADDVHDAASDPAARLELRRPKVGLALSGGGARGFAHVGVLAVLEDLRVPVDYVAGTSMGAIVGGLYATGLSSEELAAAVTAIDWGGAFKDRTPRQEISFRRKQDSFDFLTGLRLWIKDFKVALPKGLIGGQKLVNILTELALPAAMLRDFDELPIPYRAVATDAATGDAVVIAKGELVRAMWASMAIPAVFSPVEIEGKQLVDGGVSNNLPIDVVRAMGADIVIAVDISSQLRAVGAQSSVLSVSEQTLTVLMARNTREQIARLGPDDVLIKPDLGTAGAGSFDLAETLIAEGDAAAEGMRGRLRALSLAPEAYAEHVASRRKLTRELPVIASVVYDNQSPLSDYVIENRFDVRVGEPLDVELLESDIAMLYGEEIFDEVTFGLEDSDEGTVLVISTTGKAQGRNYVRFGLQLEADFEGESDFVLSALVTRNPVNALAGEWRTRLDVGNETRFHTEFFQPFTPRSRLFVLPSFSVGTNTRDVFGLNGGERLAKYRITDIDARVAIGTHLSNWAEIKLGVGYRYLDLDRTSGDPRLFPDLGFDGLAAFARISLDSLDSVTFPRSGGYGFVEGEYLPDALSQDDSIELVSGTLGYAWTFRDTTLVPSILFGTTFGSSGVLPTYTLGGFLKLSGTPPESRTGPTLLLGRLVAYHRIANPRVFSWSLPVYLGGSFEFGNIFNDLSDITGDALDLAGSVFLGVDTFLGPIYIAYGHAEGGNNAGYLFLGQVF